MADTETNTTHTVEKIYCTGDNCGTSNSALNPILSALLTNQGNNNHTDPATMMAMMNNGGGFGGAWNNPMMYIMYMWLFRYMNGWGNGTGEFAQTEALNYNNRAISQLQSTVDNNHNNDLVMQAIQGNGAAIHELATNLNVDFNTVQQALCGIKSAVENVGANVGFSAERVINAINQGDTGIINAVNTSACATQKAILEQGYQNQLATERQTGILGSKIDGFQSASQLQTCQQTNALNSSIGDVRNTLVNGFSQVGYAASQNTNAIIQAGNANTQRLADLLQNHWVAETSQSLQDAKNEISQLQQTQTLLQAINSGCGCNS